MSFSLRIFLGYFVIIGLGSWVFINSFMEEIKPAFRQAAEETMVDMANLLAEVVRDDMASGLQKSAFKKSVERYKWRAFEAQIWSLLKTRPNLVVYITNAKGIVLFHSHKAEEIGNDYSQWNDVHNTLQGEYGARSSLYDPNNLLSTVMYVAAPIIQDEQIIGVLTVAKPNLSVQPFLAALQQKLIEKGFWVWLGAILIALVLSFWLTRSIYRLADYARTIHSGENIPVPKVSGKEMRQLATAMDEMRVELEGKAYVEEYVHHLTHQMKSPLSSIIGAAELLREDMPLAQQRRFIGNIQQESTRLQQIVDYILLLVKLEKQQHLQHPVLIDSKALLKDVINTKAARLEQAGITIETHLQAGCEIQGDPFLLHQAINNLLDNAIEFSPHDSDIVISNRCDEDYIRIEIRDYGSGIPDYALSQIFSRFYSLPRPQTEQKSSGLGLSFVREIMRLHQAQVQIENAESQGVQARLSFPRTQST